MRKYAIFSLALLLVVAFVPKAFSYTINYDKISGDGVYLGGTSEVIAYNVDNDPDLDKVFQDTAENVQFVIANYNTENSTTYALLDTSYIETEDFQGIINTTFKDGDPDEIIAGTINLTTGTQFISLKWDGENGGFGVFYVAGLETFSFTISETNPYALSHYREWDASPVPEPATILLLGSGLLGVAGVTRRRLKK